ncbi:MAG: dihydropteroate synthase [Prevotella sp.]|nr:dihydropteroate synthase [Prevotella sp.]
MLNYKPIVKSSYSINCRGRLIDLSTPQVMGILNVTPDSFFAGSRKQTEAEIAERANQIVEQGGTMIDVGAMSTRPGYDDVTKEEEMRRLRLALPIIRREQPDAILSVDTFREEVARMAVEEYGVDIINDVRGEMTPPRVPYIYMSSAPTSEAILMDFAEKVQRLRDQGHKDIILDPGFGFGKTVEQNYEVLGNMERLQVMQLPILVGVSRKSMIWKKLGITPDEALNGTTALNTIALQKGATILRVHDVKEAVETVILNCQFSIFNS